MTEKFKTDAGSPRAGRRPQSGPLEGQAMRQKRVRGFQTGDMVKAVVSAGKKAGGYVGRVAIRASGSFNIQTPTAVVQGISCRDCRMLSRGDGYTYHTRALLVAARSIPPHS